MYIAPLGRSIGLGNIGSHFELSPQARDEQHIARQLREGKISAELVTSLDRALDEYGSSVKQVVYWNFEMTYGYGRESVFSHPEEFVKTLKSIFGSGAALVEKRISSEIRSAQGLDGDNSESLVNLLRTARRANSRTDL